MYSIYKQQKINAIQRSLDDHVPQHIGVAQPHKRNLDPALHPFARPKEYQRTVVASKLERIFAKPLIANLDGHSDGVYCLARDSKAVNLIASGSGNGGRSNAQVIFYGVTIFCPLIELRVWSLAGQSCEASVSKAHRGIIRDVCFSNSSLNQTSDGATSVKQGLLLSCSTDKFIKLWSLEQSESSSTTPIQTFSGPSGF